MDLRRYINALLLLLRYLITQSASGEQQPTTGIYDFVNEIISSWPVSGSKLGQLHRDTTRRQPEGRRTIRPETSSAHWAESSISAIVAVRPVCTRMG